MAQVLVTESSLQDIADAIREKNKLITLYKPSEMGAAIRALEMGGKILTATGVTTATAYVNTAYKQIYGVVTGLSFKVLGIAFQPELSAFASTSPDATISYMMDDTRNLLYVGGTKNQATNAVQYMDDAINSVNATLDENACCVLYVGTYTTSPSGYYGSKIAWFAWGIEEM